MKAAVVHATNDSARFFRLIGFEPGQDFTLVAREPNETTDTGPRKLCGKHDIDFDELLHHDAAMFGMERRDWQLALYSHESIDFRGLRENGALVGSVCIRPRRGGALCLDQVNVKNPRYLRALIEPLLAEYAERRIECFVKTSSDLHELLTENGFTVDNRWHTHPRHDSQAPPLAVRDSRESSAQTLAG